MRPSALLPLALLLAGCAAPQARPDPAPAAAPGYRIVDATGGFWAFWEAHAASDPQTQREAFKRLVVAPQPELFGPGVIGVDPTRKDSDLDERLGPFLAALPERVEAMRRVHAKIREDLGRHDASFRALFPEMRWAGTVYLTVSLDAFDGAVRGVGGAPCLLFGIDKIARLHGSSANVGPFFHHELFHVHHDQVNPAPEMKEEGPHGLLEPLWREGLAVHVSSVLHPEATAQELLLSEAMIQEATARMPALAGELRRLLDDAREADFRDFFLSRGQREDVPRRVAYYVGLLVARELARTRSLEELVGLRGPELRAAVDAALAGLERPVAPAR